jgi:Zn-dependent protease with chaperone function
MMKRQAYWLLLAAVAGCATNPYTGRHQLLLVDEKTERELGVTSYQQTLGESRVSTDPNEVGPVTRVGRRIAEAAAKPEMQWEFNVIVDDKTMNAWCLPGGKIAFYTGIFPVLQDEAGMAFVMGHEVAHALLHHGAERMSQGMATEGVASLLGVALGGKDPKVQQGVLAAFGAATNLGVLLPFSRKHETEADRIGLQLMAKAGYDPRSSIEVWKRMAAKGGEQPPQWLSTHPSHESRIQDLESHLAQATALYGISDRAPVAVLPPIGNRQGKGGQVGTGFAAEGRGGPGVTLRSAKPFETEQGAKGLRVEVAFDRDVFVRSIEVTGPDGPHRLDVGTPVPANEPRRLDLERAGAGELTLIFRGTESGRPVRAEARVEHP